MRRKLPLPCIGVSSVFFTFFAEAAVLISFDGYAGGMDKNVNFIHPACDCFYVAARFLWRLLQHTTIQTHKNIP